jgi:hypothetical protein
MSGAPAPDIFVGTMLRVPKQNCHPERSRGICGAPLGPPEFFLGHATDLYLTIAFH